MLLTYRGILYSKSPISTDFRTDTLIYRGVTYQHHRAVRDRRDPVRLTYRGQKYGLVCSDLE